MNAFPESRPFRHPVFQLAAMSLVFVLTLAGCASTDPAVQANMDAALPASDAETADATAFVGVNVIPMDRERVLPNQTVIVRDGRIAEIGPVSLVRVPEGARRIDGEGKYLMPGLAEMHAHIPSPQAEEQFGEDYAENVLFLYLANGVTVIRGMQGHPMHLELRERVERGELTGPHILTSGPALNGRSVPSPEVAARMVREQKAAGYDFLKVLPGLSREVYDTMNAVADREGIQFAGHIPADVGLRRALEAEQASIDHLDAYAEALLPPGASTENSGFFGSNLVDRMDTARITELATATRQAGVWNVPTQSLIENFAGPDTPGALAARPEMRYLPPSIIAQWQKSTEDFRANPSFSPERGERFIEIRRKLIRELHEAGAGLLLGSDAPQVFNVPGFSIHRELPMLVAAGLTPFEALQTGTRNPAVFFGEADRWGTVEEGKRADLVLLNANPLQDVANAARIAGVMVGGRWVPESEIQQRLDTIAAQR